MVLLASTSRKVGCSFLGYSKTQRESFGGMGIGDMVLNELGGRGT
jgi:hypothetical protein